MGLKDLMLSYEHARKSDLFVVAGSSLVVTPAADMPREALQSYMSRKQVSRYAKSVQEAGPRRQI